MIRLGAVLVIAVCLQPTTSQGADFGEEDNNQKKYKGAQKALAIMSLVGIEGQNVKEVAYFVDERLEGNEFRIHQSEYAGFNMKIQFNTEKIKTEGFEMKFTHEDMPNWEIKGNSEGAMLNYHLEW